MADINTIKSQLNALGYGAAVAGSPPNPNAPAALRATVDASGNLLLNGKADLGLTTALRLFQHTHALPNNGQIGAATVASLAQAYAAKEQATDAVTANQNAMLTGGAGSQFIDATTAGQTFDASGNVTGGSALDPNDPGGVDAATAAAQAAQVAAFAAGSAPGGNPIGNVPGPIVPYRPPAAPIPWWVWAIGGVVVLGSGTAIAVGVSKK
jgi:Putative peptidoglycan binding domain